MAQLELTDEQKAIIEAAPISMAVLACPGSGKTSTAVRRLAELRRRLAASRGYVLLLSYSNVAVNTFRTEYRELTGRAGDDDRVVIQTMDSFITTYLLRPHGARVMECNRTPYLVVGNEPFMANYAVGQGKERLGLEDVLLDRSANQTVFHRRFNGGGSQPLNVVTQNEAIDKAKKLAKVGGYTYALGRAWALSLLKKEPRLAAAVARRFPQILVDEAQDVGCFEGELLDLLGRSGSVVSLIGDAHQSIYGFNFATGAYLREFALREGVLSLSLSQNRRSIPAIVSLANALATTDSKPFREKSERLSGAYYWRYEKDKIPQFMSAWATAVKAASYDLGEVAVLCRAKSLLASVSPGVDEMGQSAVKHFATAAVAREQRGDIATTLEHCARLIAMRRLLWALIRNPSSGIPLGTLEAKNQWLPALKKNLADWLCVVESTTEYRRVDTWTSRVTTANLPDAGPLVATDFGQNEWSWLRFGTVHSAKGEGIPAVMYLTSKSHLDALVAGTKTEDGRIGFVAVTRARDLLVIAIPNSTAPAVIAALEHFGLVEWGHCKSNLVLLCKAAGNA
jgi:superfamily I DNA/RNA helicase